MPEHSRSRERRRDRERGSSHRRRYEEPEYYYDGREYGNEYGDYDDEEEERHYRHRSSRGQSRGYRTHAYDRVDADDVAEQEEYEDTPTRRHRSRRTPEESRPRYGDDLWRERATKAKESPATSPKKRADREGRRRHSRGVEGSPTREAAVRERRHRHRESDDEWRRNRESRRQRRRERERVAEKHTSQDSANSASQLLSADALARLNDYYESQQREEFVEQYEEAYRRRDREIPVEDLKVEKKRRRRRESVYEKREDYDDYDDYHARKSQKKRLVSGAVLEEGRGSRFRLWLRGGGGSGAGKDEGDPDSEDAGVPFWKKHKKLLIGIGILALVLIIAIPVGVVVSKQNGGDSGDDVSSSSDSDLTASLSEIDPDSIPKEAKGTELDPFTWYDTRDFNLTYTDETVGGLPVMGLFSEWDDSARPNEHVPPLNKKFPYGKQPIRGVNIGGWLSIEPFITPSFFSKYPLSEGIIDEYTLCKKLGSSAAAVLEKHYATFITEEDFKLMAEAGLDHVRIPFSYWLVTTYDGDPYVPRIGWRYLLRAIEYCRKYGLRVKLDLHGLPGSQNGWNHSGRQGQANWLNGTDGDLNGERSLDIHDRLSKFFAQPRYKNIITIYGLANEPRMLNLPIRPVLDWTKKAAELVRKNGVDALIAFHDGFLNLDKWQHILKDGPDGMLLDTHQYTIFNMDLIALTHRGKIDLACKQWLPMLKKVNSKTNGWGPTICGEWSQADTDCARYLNNVGRGTRWYGDYTDPRDPRCPTEMGKTEEEKRKDNETPCSCTPANAPASSYSDEYKLLLKTYAEAQMSAFEAAYGWFYWTWQTESAPQWSYRQAWEGGFLPAKAYEPDFRCGDEIPDFGDLPEYY